MSDFTIKVKRPGTGHILIPDQEAEFEEFRVHKIVLAARSPTFFTQFCGEWKDAEAESRLDQFEPEPMRTFLNYVYTGKAKLELRSLMGVL